MKLSTHTGEKSGSSGESIGDTSSREDETHPNSYGEGESGEEDCCYRRAEAEDSRRLQGEAWAWKISHLQAKREIEKGEKTVITR